MTRRRSSSHSSASAEPSVALLQARSMQRDRKRVESSRESLSNSTSEGACSSWKTSLSVAVDKWPSAMSPLIESAECMSRRTTCCRETGAAAEYRCMRPKSAKTMALMRLIHQGNSPDQLVIHPAPKIRRKRHVVTSPSGLSAAMAAMMPAPCNPLPLRRAEANKNRLR